MSGDEQVAFAVLVVVILAVIVGMTGATASNVKHMKHTLDRMEKQQRNADRCTHGESSIIAEMRHGKLYVSKPTVTGCQP